jgi:SAM-dependent methyltransferase
MESRFRELSAALKSEQYTRYAMYRSHIDFVEKHFAQILSKDTKIIEFGGSNGFLELVFKGSDYKIADNYPAVDVEDLSAFDDNYYDVVILDEVLEHVRKPWKAVSNIHRILKPGGYLISSSPFMIAEHKCPLDYWRFTKDGLGVLLEDFKEVQLHSWGNPKSVEYLLNGMMVSSEQAMNDEVFDLENQDKYAITVWAYAKK